MIYIITFIRIIVSFVFALSFVTKLRNFGDFQHAIENFQLLPSSLHRPVAVGFMTSELVIVVSAVIGGAWLFLCYSLTIILLLLFVYALNSVLRRKISTTCNCFGSSAKTVSRYDIWRNLIIIFIAVMGLLGLFISNSQILYPTRIEFLISALMAAMASILLLNLHELAELFNSTE